MVFINYMRILEVLWCNWPKELLNSIASIVVEEQFSSQLLKVMVVTMRSLGTDVVNIIKCD